VLLLQPLEAVGKWQRETMGGAGGGGGEAMGGRAVAAAV
jgi:hypothetical protein